MGTKIEERELGVHTGCPTGYIVCLPRKMLTLLVEKDWFCRPYMWSFTEDVFQIPHKRNSLKRTVCRCPILGAERCLLACLALPTPILPISNDASITNCILSSTLSMSLVSGWLGLAAALAVCRSGVYKRPHGILIPSTLQNLHCRQFWFWCPFPLLALLGRCCFYAASPRSPSSSFAAINVFFLLRPPILFFPPRCHVPPKRYLTSQSTTACDTGGTPPSTWLASVRVHAWWRKKLLAWRR